jgi:hypothetical protein
MEHHESPSLMLGDDHSMEEEAQGRTFFLCVSAMAIQQILIKDKLLDRSRVSAAQEADQLIGVGSEMRSIPGS